MGVEENTQMNEALGRINQHREGADEFDRCQLLFGMSEKKPVIHVKVKAQTQGIQSRVLSTSELHSHRRKSKASGLVTDKKFCLTIQQKIDVMLQELDEMRESKKKFQKTSESNLEALKAEIEESENRFTELKKAQCSFDRDITRGSLHPRTGNVMAEKVQRDVDKVHDLMDEVQEQQEIANEISEAISNPVGFGHDIDEDELSKELEELEQEELDKQLLDVEGPVTENLPSPPQAEPSTSSKAKVHEDEDEDIKELAAWAS
ncbi:putative charged multivesicular body protein 4B-like protein CHMP4BP1 [Limulus polyphemus]|uniref:Charged multivesicular body protein 4B-like protein CHMP4BP1 n=1 Tax=Limulus polyphemus TaxID=6850 RepID=A0ABM1T6C6_LIMPO|nr:putative charged multivesicular body protein 4B-like protein CHMP4BP1 [Limulus polyphemus]